MCIHVCACPQEREGEKPWCFIHHRKPSLLMLCIDECSRDSLGALHGNKQSLQPHVLWCTACQKERNVSCYITTDQGWSVGKAARSAKDPLVKVETHQDIRPLQLLLFLQVRKVLLFPCFYVGNLCLIFVAIFQHLIKSLHTPSDVFLQNKAFQRFFHIWKKCCQDGSYNSPIHCSTLDSLKSFCSHSKSNYNAER